MSSYSGYYLAWQKLTISQIISHLIGTDKERITQKKEKSHSMIYFLYTLVFFLHAYLYEGVGFPGTWQWVARTAPGSFGKAVSAVNHWTISPAPKRTYF